jgi:hypothetical protein
MSYSVVDEMIRLPQSGAESPDAGYGSWEPIPGTDMCLRRTDDEDITIEQRPDPWGARYPEAVYMGINDGVNIWVYQHWRSGETVRYLAFLGDGGWAAPAGSPEPWEEALIWGEKALKDMEDFIAGMDDPYSDPAEIADKTEKIRRNFRERRIEEGDYQPYVAPFDVLKAVRDHYSLNG